MKLILPDAKLHIKYCVGCWFWWLWYRDCGGAVGVICHCFTNRLVALAPRITILIQTQEMENWFLTRQITGKRSSVLFNQASLMENQPRQSFEHVQKNSILTTQFDIVDKISSYQITCSVPRHGHTNKWYFSKKYVLAAQVFTHDQRCIEKISFGWHKVK